MKSILISIMFLSLTISLFASKKDIQKIRKIYKNAANLEECHTLKTNKILPAVGLQTKTIKYCFKSEQINPEKDPYLMKYKLVKVEIDYNRPMIKYHAEYLYNDKEKLVFYYKSINKAGDGANTGGEEADHPEYITSLRNYFKNGKLIKVMTVTSREKQVKKTKKFTKKELKSTKLNIQNSKKLLLLFKNIMEVDEFSD